ncbi:LysR substrate-binding domain-containing protein [Legionella sp. km772]|uniref:LysR substrate-binding domain-containing protein n=1 Tax=Legionella sp. km772 TaxID=2498111 RepID=UPI000F8ECA95|nr:LysR substrate-binding domain-containing protein [Legionella sp. km772]RUR06062.1 hypothetical protein ELY15_13595 [Legionella sp. km772]
MSNNERIYLQNILFLNDAQAILECVLQGLGIAILHHYQIVNALEQGDLVELLCDYRMPAIPIFMYYHPGRYMQPKVRSWIEFIGANWPESL